MIMALRIESNRGAWTAEEDQKLAQAIDIYGPKRWKTIATKTGLNRCGKSCRLRWMNYLRPNIKRGNISDQEEDMILRLHKLLGNRWSLIAGRLPGRTDNEIKNYWNSRLSKKIKLEKQDRDKSHSCKIEETNFVAKSGEQENICRGDDEYKCSIIVDELFDWSCDGKGPLNLDRISKFLDFDESWFV